MKQAKIRVIGITEGRGAEKMFKKSNGRKLSKFDRKHLQIQESQWTPSRTYTKSLLDTYDNTDSHLQREN